MMTVLALLALVALITILRRVCRRGRWWRNTRISRNVDMLRIRAFELDINGRWRRRYASSWWWWYASGWWWDGHDGLWWWRDGMISRPAVHIAVPGFQCPSRSVDYGMAMFRCMIEIALSGHEGLEAREIGGDLA